MVKNTMSIKIDPFLDPTWDRKALGAIELTLIQVAY
jgi:hypothetical protein